MSSPDTEPLTIGDGATRDHGTALLLINPSAGQKANLPTNFGGRPQVEAALRDAGIAFDVMEPSSAEDSTQRAADAARRGVPLVIAAGGDGTVQTVAAGLLGTGTAMGIMPLGSFNNVARSLGVPRNLGEAATILAEGRTSWIDVGRVDTQMFLEAAGIGMDAAIMPHSNALGEGHIGAIRELVLAVLSFRQGHLHLVLDGKHTRTHALMVSVANGPYSLAGLTLAPHARLDDRVLDVVVYDHLRKIDLFFALAGIFVRRGFPDHRIHRFQARQVTVRGRRQWPVQADAHLCGTTPKTIVLDDRRLRVVHGQEAALTGAGATPPWWEPVDLPPKRERRNAR